MKKTGRNPKMGKNWPKNRTWPSARNGEKMAQKWRENRKITPFLPFLGHFSPISGRGPFLFFGQFSPIFGFRPVFHSIPGHLTSNSRLFQKGCQGVDLTKKAIMTHSGGENVEGRCRPSILGRFDPIFGGQVCIPPYL